MVSLPGNELGIMETRSNSDDIVAMLDKIVAKLDSIGSFKEDIAFLKRLAASREKSHAGERRSEEEEDLNGDGSGCTAFDITSETNACDNFRMYDFKNGTSDDAKKIVSTLNASQVPSPDVVEVAVSPPFVFIPYVKSELRPEFQVAVQNYWVKKGGGPTGIGNCKFARNWQGNNVTSRIFMQLNIKYGAHEIKYKINDT